MHRTIGAVAASVLLAATSVPAVAAGGLQAAATRVGNYTNTSTSLVAVPLDDTGYTSLAFTTTKAKQKVVITYNAECGAVGPIGDWMTVEVTVDGALASPASGTSFAFCTATSTTSYSWIGATRQALYVVATPGSHVVQVLGAGEGVTTWWLGDTSLTVTE